MLLLLWRLHPCCHYPPLVSGVCNLFVAVSFYVKSALQCFKQLGIFLQSGSRLLVSPFKACATSAIFLGMMYFSLTLTSHSYCASVKRFGVTFSFFSVMAVSPNCTCMSINLKPPSLEELLLLGCWFIVLLNSERQGSEL